MEKESEFLAHVCVMVCGFESSWRINKPNYYYWFVESNKFFLLQKLFVLEEQYFWCRFSHSNVKCMCQNRTHYVINYILKILFTMSSSTWNMFHIFSQQQIHGLPLLYFLISIKAVNGIRNKQFFMREIKINALKRRLLAVDENHLFLS